MSVDNAHRAASHLVCCQVDLPPEKRQGLRCEVNGSDAIEGTYDNGTITCQSPKDYAEVADVEKSGLTCKVMDRNGEVVHVGACAAVVGAQNADHIALPPDAPSRRQRFKEKYGALLPFAIISISYLLFTITDGAVRMIVLLHAYNQGFTAMEVAIMFTLYEVAGVVTNLAAGMLGARWGLKTTLLSGLTVQLVGLGMLFGWQNDWAKATAIVYVTASQMLCGVAKDLTKLGGKTVTKLVTPEGQNSSLFKLVSFITGWKNSLKGVGYFLGAATVSVSYYLSLAILCVLVVLAIPPAFFGLSNALGRARKENVTFRQLFNNSHNINVLSLSRVFLFGSRDLWFEVPLPFFLRDPASGIGWSRPLTGAFLAIFIIVYGQVQSWTPQIALQPLRQSPPDKFAAFWWCSSLAVPTAILGGIMLGSDVFGPGVPEAPAAVTLTVLLYTFCILFAVNSAIHSYLIVRYASGNKVAMQVGVYYASNAMGRLVGTLLSGALFTYAGSTTVDRFGVCLFASVAFSSISTLVDVYLTESQAGSSWLGPFNRCLPWVPAPPVYRDVVEGEGMHEPSGVDGGGAVGADAVEMAAVKKKDEEQGDGAVEIVNSLADEAIPVPAAMRK